VPNLRYLLMLPLWAVAGAAHAHIPGAATQPLGEAWICALIMLAVSLYGVGLMRLWRRSRERARYGQRAILFGLGMLALVALLLGTLDPLAATSFAAHMVQHEGLMLIAAPLLVLGHGLPVMLWAFPSIARLRLAHFFYAPSARGPWHALTSPLSAWLLHAAALWIWHAPAFFNAALRNPAVHEWQHVSFLATALLFWHSLLKRSAQRAQGTSVLYLFTTTVHTSVLGALITFASAPLYAPIDRALTVLPGLSPLEDQQLGGLIMWVPGALVYVAVGLWLMARWIGDAGEAGEWPNAGGRVKSAGSQLPRARAHP